MTFPLPVNPNGESRRKMPTAQFFSNTTPSHDERSMFQHIINAVADGDTRTLQSWMRKVNSPHRLVWHCGQPGAKGVQQWPPSPLHRAVETEQLRCIDILISHGFSLNAALIDR